MKNISIIMIVKNKMKTNDEKQPKSKFERRLC